MRIAMVFDDGSGDAGATILGVLPPKFEYDLLPKNHNQTVAWDKEEVSLLSMTEYCRPGT